MDHIVIKISAGKQWGECTQSWRVLNYDQNLPDHEHKFELPSPQIVIEDDGCIFEFTGPDAKPRLPMTVAV